MISRKKERRLLRIEKYNKLRKEKGHKLYLENLRSIYVDASYKEEIAGLAIIGFPDNYSKKIQIESSNRAEIQCLKWAIQIARELEINNVTFKTDSQSAYNIVKLKEQDIQNSFRIEIINRRYNLDADSLSRKTRKCVDNN